MSKTILLQHMISLSSENNIKYAKSNNFLLACLFVHAVPRGPTVLGWLLPPQMIRIKKISLRHSQLFRFLLIPDILELTTKISHRSPQRKKLEEPKAMVTNMLTFNQLSIFAIYKNKIKSEAGKMTPKLKEQRLQSWRTQVQFLVSNWFIVIYNSSSYRI